MRIKEIKKEEQNKRRTTFMMIIFILFHFISPSSLPSAPWNLTWWSWAEEATEVTSSQHHHHHPPPEDLEKDHHLLCTWGDQNKFWNLLSKIHPSHPHNFLSPHHLIWCHVGYPMKSPDSSHWREREGERMRQNFIPFRDHLVGDHETSWWGEWCKTETLHRIECNNRTKYIRRRKGEKEKKRDPKNIRWGEERKLNERSVHRTQQKHF